VFAVRRDEIFAKINTRDCSCNCWVFDDGATARSIGACSRQRHYIGSGFSFDDGSQVLVSAQKPLGMILEQEVGPIVVSEVDPSGSAGRAGVQVGDVLLAVQNADVSTKPLEEALTLIGRAPRVVNLRFQRR
jgi:S1-C subfamily serine protease